MKISVVLSTYNGEKYLLPQLDSLKNQTYSADEVLIFDDGSTDQTVNLIDQYISKNQLKNWKLSKNEKNIGWRKNFMEGIRKCTGDIIFTCDQDDIWNLSKIEKMKSVMEEDAQIGLLVSSYTEFYADNDRYLPTPCKKEERKSCVRKIPLSKNILEVPYPGCTYCIRKEFFYICSPYWIETCPHDALLWRSAMILGRAYLLEESMVLWRKHSTSAWQREVHTVSRQSELDWRNLERMELEKLRIFAQKQDASLKATAIIEKNLKWCEMRTEFLRDKNTLVGINLIIFIEQYHGLKRYIKDWLIAFTK